MRIDGQDALTTHGIRLLEGSYRSAIAYPPLKTVEINDWPDEDGIEADLKNPKLNTRNITLIFSANSLLERTDFIDLMSTGSFHSFELPYLSTPLMLRMVSEQANTEIQDVARFSIVFADDYPMYDYTYTAPVSTGIRANGYLMDGKDFSVYGIVPRDGTNDNIERMPPVKTNLLVNTSIIDGAIYDGLNVYFGQKDTVLLLNLRASLDDFWTNYYAFLHDLIQPGERIFRYPNSDNEYPFYYLSSTVDNFAVSEGEIWCDFRVTIRFTQFRIGEDYFLLAAENGDLVVTEDNINYIDLKWQ